MDIKVYIEIPQGSRVKYERDEETGMLMCDRILHTPMHYPANYGFVIDSIGEDGDPTDIILLASGAPRCFCCGCCDRYLGNGFWHRSSRSI